MITEWMCVWIANMFSSYRPNELSAFPRSVHKSSPTFPEWFHRIERLSLEFRVSHLDKHMCHHLYIFFQGHLGVRGRRFKICGKHLLKPPFHEIVSLLCFLAKGHIIGMWRIRLPSYFIVFDRWSHLFLQTCVLSTFWICHSCFFGMLPSFTQSLMDAITPAGVFLCCAVELMLAFLFVWRFVRTRCPDWCQAVNVARTVFHVHCCVRLGLWLPCRSCCLQCMQMCVYVFRHMTCS